MDTARMGMGMCALAVVTGCSTSAEMPSGDASQTLSADIDTFVTVGPDLRRCRAPLCGGYFVRNVNEDDAPVHVSGLVFDESRLDAETIHVVTDAPLGELVLRGHLGTAEPRDHSPPFIVRDAYRGLPGQSAAATEAFYHVGKQVPPIVCVTTPCPSEVAIKLNINDQQDIDGVSVDDLETLFVDKAWLSTRVERHGALVAGSVDDPRPREPRQLRAHQVFLHLPERRGPCRSEAEPVCREGEPTFHRTVDRCLTFAKCLGPGTCNDVLPRCATGYTLSSWTAAPSGCPAFACDPTFAL